MLNSFIAFYGWEPVLWFGVSVVAFPCRSLKKLSRQWFGVSVVAFPCRSLKKLSRQWFGVSVVAFFGAVLCLNLYSAGKG